MPIRLYLTNTAATFTPTTLRGSWNSTDTTARLLGHTRSGTNTIVNTSESSSTLGWNTLQRRFISAPLRGGSIPAIADAALAIAIARQETPDTLANLFLRVHIYFTVGDTDAVRATLLDNDLGPLEAQSAMQVSWTDQYEPTAAAVVQPGDRLVIELGFSAQNTTTTAQTHSIRIGGTAADLTATNNSTVGITTDCPWVDFSNAFLDVLQPLGSASGPMNATMDKATASFGAAVVPQGGMVATLRKATSASVGVKAQDVTGTIAASMDKLVNVAVGQRVITADTVVLTLPGLGQESSDIMSKRYEGFALSEGHDHHPVAITRSNSIAANVSILDAAINEFPGVPKVVIGHSRGAQIAVEWIKQHQNDPDRPDPLELLFVFGGNPVTKYGGVPWDCNGQQERSAAAGNAGGWQVWDVRREDDGWANWPDKSNPFNSNGSDLIKLATAIVGMFTTHSSYTAIDLGDLENEKLSSIVDGNTTYYLLP